MHWQLDKGMTKGIIRKTRDVILAAIVYILIYGPIIIIVVTILYTCYGKADSIINDKPFHSHKKKKVYYTIDGECYHDSTNCPTLQRSDHVYSAYRDELPGRTQCMQCDGWR